MVNKPELYDTPKKKKAPPFWIRLWLLFTCTGVSFAHGSNDGQKGMGLVMLILIVALPAIYGPYVAITAIPFWVKLVVALALGFGTMIGYKRVVKTVGEKIGKKDMAYAQGAVAEMVTMTTIGAADMFGLPVSTTHILNSSVAGTMAANGSGMNYKTVGTILSAWILTLPVTMLLSGVLFLLLGTVW